MSETLTADTQAIEIANLGTLAEEIIYLMPGCSDLMVRKEIQRSFRDFCEKTSAWRHTVVKTLEHDKTAYTITLPFPCVVDSVYFANIDGVTIEEKTDYTLTDGDCLKITLNEGLVSEIDDTATEKSCLYVYCILRPEVGSEDCPAFFLKKYADAIIAGAKANLHGMSGKPWSDKGMAQLEIVEYGNWKTKATIDAVAGQKTSSTSGRKAVDCFNYGGTL